MIDFLGGLDIGGLNDPRPLVDLGHMPYGASVPIENGSVTIPDLPGLGPDPDEALLTRFRV